MPHRDPISFSLTNPALANTLRASLTVLIALGLWVTSGTVSAQSLVPITPVESSTETRAYPDTMETARGMAMGLGARASASGTNGVAYNPAGMSIGRHYHIESAVLYEPQAARFATGGALVDSHSGPVNMGTHFRYVHGNGNNGHGGYDGRVALGLPLGENFAIGMTGRYMSFWQEGQEDVPAFAERITFDAAIRITPLPGFHIALLGNNLLDVGSSLVPMQAGGSLSYTFENVFTIAVDGLADLSTWKDEGGNIIPQALFGGGAELFTGEVPIRVGYIFDTGRNRHYVTAGIGWMNREMGVDIGYRQQVTGPMDTWLLASYRYLVH